jgi:hypothetical protein
MRCALTEHLRDRLLCGRHGPLQQFSRRCHCRVPSCGVRLVESNLRLPRAYVTVGNTAM